MRVSLSTAARRVVAVTVAAIAALAVSTAAYAAASSPGAARTPATAIPRCTTSDLRVRLAVDQANGTAGTFYYPLDFRNIGHHTCYLSGYPGVSALDRKGRQLGSPAGWGSRAGTRIVNVAPGATAHTELAYHDVAVTTESGCDPVNSAVDLRVYPPDQRSSTDAAFTLEACSHAGPVWMSIYEPIIPGAGTIYG
jgi:hypothetical protein